MSKATLHNWLHEKTGPSRPPSPRGHRPHYLAAIAPAASVDAVPIPGSLTSFVAEIAGEWASLQIPLQRQKTFRKEARMESLPGDREDLLAQLLTVGSREGAGGELLEF